MQLLIDFEGIKIEQELPRTRNEHVSDPVGYQLSLGLRLATNRNVACPPSGRVLVPSFHICIYFMEKFYLFLSPNLDSGYSHYSSK